MFNDVVFTWKIFGALTSDASAELRVAAKIPAVISGPHALSISTICKNTLYPYIPQAINKQ
jgi:hypothetical protein